MFCVELCRVCIYYIILYTLSIRNARKRKLGGPHAEANAYAENISHIHKQSARHTCIACAKVFATSLPARRSAASRYIYTTGFFGVKFVCTATRDVRIHHIHTEYTRRRRGQKKTTLLKTHTKNTRVNEACGGRTRDIQHQERESSASHRIATRIATTRRVCRFGLKFPKDKPNYKVIIRYLVCLRS